MGSMSNEETRPAVGDYRDFFAAVFAEMDACPRRTGVRFTADGLEIGVINGNPVFRLGGQTLAADFRGRWLPEHPVPLKIEGDRPRKLYLVPTTGNRVKVMTSRFAWWLSWLK